ncbi:MAG: hypothetical protein KatS3mg082_1102 [Nitrospiraceae bacterium]|nr:MAG: hypothetical protein KatS3mg082_1102 [Nitrospiraceae bacterium]
MRLLRPPAEFAPSVDIFIPIYTESCDILEKTLIGAGAIEYANKRLYVLDDGHRPEVAKLAADYGAVYLKGPRRHAKAGNLNHALSQTTGELVVVFDTDHIPVTSFLQETVPFFADPQVAFVQTPHHFYNQDIYQRALSAGPRIPNEQDLFNHAIQGGRAPWNGAFFVGSGAVFRRSAIVEIGGFNLMSITEDIHTSQHLHAKGWRSVFLDKDLAVGLTAETLSSYIVQRRRWMLGCLHIFFRDNPLFCRGLTWRQRLGYFASLYYFFFPAARVVFWITPLYYLFFHLHPIFSDVSILVAYLLPFLVILPLLSYTLLPGWPRLLWASLYEMPVSFPLFRSMFDLLLPKRLGFKVTPKGLTSDRRKFAWGSAKGLVFATGITPHRHRQGPGGVLLFRHRKGRLLLQPELGLAESVPVAGRTPYRLGKAATTRRRADSKIRIVHPAGQRLHPAWADRGPQLDRPLLHHAVDRPDPALCRTHAARPAPRHMPMPGGLSRTGRLRVSVWPCHSGREPGNPPGTDLESVCRSAYLAERARRSRTEQSGYGLAFLSRDRAWISAAKADSASNRSPQDLAADARADRIAPEGGAGP